MIIQVVNTFVSTAFAGSTITVPSGKTASDLSNYPVYLNLADMPSGFWNNVNSDGGNIRIKQSGSVIPFDMVQIDTSGKTGTVFFKASTLASASDNVFTIDLSGSALLANNDTNGRNNCWSAFDLVWLGTSTTDVTDRTGGADGTRTGTLGATKPGALNAGCGADFDTSGDRITWTSRTSRTTYTLAATGDLTPSGISANMRPIATAASILARDFTSPDYWETFDATNSHMTGTGVAVNGSPIRLHGVMDTTVERKIYANGVIGATQSTITQVASGTTIVVGASGAGTDSFNGQIAYCYLRPEKLSANYIAAEYSNLNAPSSFYTIT